MNELNTIINMAIALSKSWGKEISHLDIKFDSERDDYGANLSLDEITCYRIHGDGSVDALREPVPEKPPFIKELEETPAKPPAEEKPSASAALEGMKIAIDKLEVPKKPKGSTAHKRLDVGKIMALYNAGWNLPKIADEMGVATTTIHYHIKKLRQEGKVK